MYNSTTCVSLTNNMISLTGLTHLPTPSNGVATKPLMQVEFNRGTKQYVGTEAPFFFLANRSSYYNSPELSDVIVVVSDSCIPSGTRTAFIHRIHAHEAILTAGSNAFRRYFENHEKV